MNGIEKISAGISAKADEAVKKIQDENLAAVSEIQSDYAARAGRLTEELKAKAQARAAEFEKRFIANAQMQARQSVLAAKQEVMEEAFAKAAKMSASNPGQLTQLRLLKPQLQMELAKMLFD